MSVTMGVDPYLTCNATVSKTTPQQGEVKSQNDSLDDRQAAWLHVLTAAGLQAKVIHVRDPKPVAD